MLFWFFSIVVLLCIDVLIVELLLVDLFEELLSKDIFVVVLDRIAELLLEGLDRIAELLDGVISRDFLLFFDKSGDKIGLARL